jgi:hypothetical protein
MGGEALLDRAES